MMENKQRCNLIRFTRGYERLSLAELHECLSHVYLPWLEKTIDGKDDEERKVSHEGSRGVNTRVDGTTVGGDQS